MCGQNVPVTGLPDVLHGAHGRPAHGPMPRKIAIHAEGMRACGTGAGPGA